MDPGADLGVHARHAGWRVEQAVPRWVLPDRVEDLDHCSSNAILVDLGSVNPVDQRLGLSVGHGVRLPST